MDAKGLKAFEDKMADLILGLWEGIKLHPLLTASVLILSILTWCYFQGAYGPQTWSLSPERPRILRRLVHILVLPLRLLAALFSSFVALLVLSLLIGFAYVIWRVSLG